MFGRSLKNIMKYNPNLSFKANKGSSRSDGLPPPHTDPKMPNTKLFINNEWVDSAKPGNYFSTINPTTGKVITDVQASSKEDVDRAIEAAKAAFHPDSPWRKMDASNRAKLIQKFADLIDRDLAYIASLETLEVGKLYGVTAGAEIKYVAENVRHLAGWSDKIYGDVIPVDGDTICYTRKEPVGVCGLISAWNFSVIMNSFKLGQSLAAGNVTIVKPSQHATLSILHLVELTREAGFPPGVINLLPGSGDLGRVMCSHPDIDLISFTGSTQAGQDVYRSGAVNIKRLVLELGGKSPIVVFDDADLDLAVQTAHLAIFHNAGQCCCAGSRVYVHENVFDEFVRRSKELTKKRKIGDPFNLKTLHGPQANEEQLNSIMRYVDMGKSEGANLEMGGSRCDRDGFFMEPTIFTNVDDNMTISKEEIFGPVQLISPFKTMEEAIERSNNSPYGLASSIFTTDVNKISIYSQCVKAGNVWVNMYFGLGMHAPFGGFKMSGLYREGGKSGVEVFTEEKAIHIKTPIKIS